MPGHPCVLPGQPPSPTLRHACPVCGQGWRWTPLDQHWRPDSRVTSLDLLEAFCWDALAAAQPSWRVVTRWWMRRRARQLRANTGHPRPTLEVARDRAA